MNTGEKTTTYFLFRHTKSKPTLHKFVYEWVLTYVKNTFNSVLFIILLKKSLQQEFLKQVYFQLTDSLDIYLAGPWCVYQLKQT